MPPQPLSSYFLSVSKKLLTRHRLFNISNSTDSSLFILAIIVNFTYYRSIIFIIISTIALIVINFVVKPSRPQLDNIPSNSPNSPPSSQPRTYSIQGTKNLIITFVIIETIITSYVVASAISSIISDYGAVYFASIVLIILFFLSINVAINIALIYISAQRIKYLEAPSKTVRNLHYCLIAIGLLPLTPSNHTHSCGHYQQFRPMISSNFSYPRLQKVCYN